MPLFLTLALIMLSPTAPGQIDRDPAAGIEAERVELSPGDRIAFTLAQGFSHQLLRKTKAARPAPHAIIISYAVINGESLVTISSRTGYPTRCSVLADPKGDGGFVPAGMIDVPGDGTLVEKRWPQAMGVLNIGNFEGGLQGGAGGTFARR